VINRHSSFVGVTTRTYSLLSFTSVRIGGVLGVADGNRDGPRDGDIVARWRQGGLSGVYNNKCFSNIKDEQIVSVL
jgi:hypothetical protein